MRLFTVVTRLCFALACGSLFGAAVSIVYAQALTPQQAPSCEVQLDAAQRVILQLRKERAQSEFQNVTMQEQLLDMQKKQAATPAPDPKGKAAEKK